MKTKEIPFSLEMVKKIQAGEIKGKIKTRGGKIARFIGEIKDPAYPLMFAIRDDITDVELPRNFTPTGNYYDIDSEHYYDIILEIPDNTQEEYRFKPFDKVLVRDRDDLQWRADIFSHMKVDKYICVGTIWDQCIPYEGNEHLLGTTNKPNNK